MSVCEWDRDQNTKRKRARQENERDKKRRGTITAHTPGVRELEMTFKLTFGNFASYNQFIGYAKACFLFYTAIRPKGEDLKIIMTV